MALSSKFKNADLRPEVEYMGHVVSEKGVKVDHKKKKSVRNYAAPKNVDQLRAFFGLANYVNTRPRLTFVHKIFFIITSNGRIIDMFLRMVADSKLVALTQ